MARSLTSETKAKFDALLKAALTKKNTNSTLNLIVNYEDKGDDNEASNIPYAEDEEESKKFMLDKFLNEDTKNVPDQKPIPNVRKKLQHQKFTISDQKSLDQSDRSDQTFDISKNEGSIQSVHSNRTFDIHREQSSTSEDSNKTYNVAKTEVGDILVHNRASAISILKINEDYSESSIAESIRTQPEEIEMVETASKVGAVSEVEKSDMDIEKSVISYEDEVSNKRKKKNNHRKEKELKDEEGIREENNNFKYDRILSIVVHRTDRLKLNKFIVHPMVKIHIVDYESGMYVKKTDPGRAGVMYFENKDIDYLMPVLTQNFNLQEQRKFYPEWEESVIVNEDFNYICDKNTNVMLLFELLDFLNFDVASSQSHASSRGWHQIAWAFLKLNSSDGTKLNTNKKLRLQLYKPGELKRGSVCPVYDWWKGKRIKYPSTLYVTIKDLVSPDAVIEAFRSKTPLEREKSQSIFTGEEIKKDTNVQLLEDDKRIVDEVLMKLEEKSSNLPNKTHRELSSGDEGCFTLKFSNAGQYLACSVLENKMYTLILYFAPDFEQFYKLASHQELVYNITFSNDDSLLLTSSADGTVSTWDLRKMTFLQMLPHPSFVYWCEVSRDNFIITGCYDKIVRVWGVNKDRKNMLEYELCEELDGHDGYVTSICISSKCDCFYSSDAIGAVIFWQRNGEHWELFKKMVLPELRNTVINQIILLKKEKRLIVHSRDSILRIVDIKNECILYWLEGAVNNRVRTTCCISPCYSYIYVGSENGSIIVWNIENGKLVAVYHPYTKLSLKDLPIHAVDFSAKSNLLAFSHFGHKIPISVYTFDPLVSDVEVKIYDVERKWKMAANTAVHKEKKKRNRLGSSEHVVDLKEILEKIDRIIN